jgi:hypothetical protein
VSWGTTALVGTIGFLATPTAGIIAAYWLKWSPQGRRRLHIRADVLERRRMSECDTETIPVVTIPVPLSDIIPPPRVRRALDSVAKGRGVGIPPVWPWPATDHVGPWSTGKHRRSPADERYRNHLTTGHSGPV